MLLNVRPCPEWLYLTFGSILAGIVVVGKSFTNKDGGDLVDIVNKLRTCSLLVLDPGVDGQNWENVSKVLEITGFPFNVLYGQTRVTVSEFGPPADDPVSRETDVIKEENCNLIVALAPRIATLVQKRVCHLFLLNRTPHPPPTLTTILAGR